jgi:hypothetical protein
VGCGLWAVSWWAGQKKKVWANYEQVLRTIFFIFLGSKKFNFFYKKVFMQLFSAEAIVFSKRFNFFYPENMKKIALKTCS